MGKTQPILQGIVTRWEDGVTEYGYDEIDRELRLYVLAHKDKQFNDMKREETNDGMDLREQRFKLFDPDELSVDQYESIQENGFHFHEVTVEDLIRMLRAGFDGRACPYSDGQE